MLGAWAALGSSCTWAYASARYAHASREVGSERVNLSRAAVILPVYVVIVLAMHGRGMVAGATSRSCSWLAVSVLCSYGFADGLFFTAARRIGVSTSLAIASAYPLWAALEGAAFGGERFGPWRASGTLLCVGGVIALVKLAGRGAEAGRDRADVVGIGLAFVTSILWAGNSVAIKEGAVGIDVMQVNLIRYAIAFVVLAIQVLASKTPPPQPRPTGGWPSLVPAILADCLFGSVFYVYGLAHTDLAVGATLSSLAPLLSVPFAIWLGEERWSTARFFAVTATVLGVVVLMLG